MRSESASIISGNPQHLIYNLVPGQGSRIVGLCGCIIHMQINDHVKKSRDDEISSI
jgi:hypothetical protein